MEKITDINTLYTDWIMSHVRDAQHNCSIVFTSDFATLVTQQPLYCVVDVRLRTVSIFNRKNGKFGFSKCADGDVFDGRIGVAIAWARYCNEKIPDFVKSAVASLPERPHCVVEIDAYTDGDWGISGDFGFDNNQCDEMYAEYEKKPEDYRYIIRRTFADQEKTINYLRSLQKRIYGRDADSEQVIDSISSVIDDFSKYGYGLESYSDTSRLYIEAFSVSTFSLFTHGVV